MPNVAAVVKLSATVLCAGRHATAARMAEARKIFEFDRPRRRAARAGHGAFRQRPDVRLPDHRGPVGRRRARRPLPDVASALTVQTVLGAAKMAEVMKIHPAMMKDMVTFARRHGDRRAAQPRAHRLRAILMDAVEAADRALEGAGGV